MSKLLNIGIVGCGAIGSSLAEVISRDFSKKARIAGLYDIDINKTRYLSDKVCKKKSLALSSLDELIKRSQLLIESASSACSWVIVRKALAGGCDVMVMSVGGIVGHTQELISLAERHNARVYIPSGAISGIDALKAAREGEIRKVTLTTIKNPQSFKGVKYVEDKGIALERIKKETILFEGPAKDAVKYFPQNINVAAVLSIAGVGENRTYVKIVASAAVTKNIHQIEIESNAGKIFTRTENIVHPSNPKTSYLAVLAAAATLRQILTPVRIGT